jgi:Arc/MetJ-type ribon-helix-helix transcriptional regulator
MKTVTIRLPEDLVADLQAESRERGVSVSDVMRERLLAPRAARAPSFSAIADLVGSIEGLPTDLSSRKKSLLKAGYGRNRSR